jgi:hypothetical protein
VVHDQVGDHPDPPRVRGVDQLLHVVHGPVVGMDVGEVRDVVAAVAQRRGVEGQKPDAVDAQPLQVVELLRQPSKVAHPVPIGVVKPAHVDLVEDRALEPQRLGLEPLAGLSLGRRIGIAGRRRARPRPLGGQQMGQGGRPDRH